MGLDMKEFKEELHERSNHQSKDQRANSHRTIQDPTQEHYQNFDHSPG